MEWYWIVFLWMIFFFVVYNCIFYVPNVKYGLPSSYFTGRFKKDQVDENGFYIPIHKPYGEGFHLKWPWWKIFLIDREVKTKDIMTKEYQVSAGPDGKGGGSLRLNGVIQYRPSFAMLFRVIEVDDNAISAGLDADIDYTIGSILGAEGMDFEQAITMRPLLVTALRDRLKSKVIERRDDENNNPVEIRRTLFGREIEYAEHSYGIEVLNVSINSIDPSEDIRQARDRKQRELYEKTFQRTEWDHMLALVNDLKGTLPNVREIDLLRAVQVFLGQIDRNKVNVNELKIDSPDFMSGFLGVLHNMTKGRVNNE